MKKTHRFARHRRPLALSAFLAALTALTLPATALADYSWNFPPPVTPIARDTLVIRGVVPIGERVVLAAIAGDGARKFTGRDLARAFEHQPDVEEQQGAWPFLPQSQGQYSCRKQA